MNEKIKSFMEYVSADEKLKAEMKSTLEGTNKKEQVSKIIAFAKKHGHELTGEDFATGSEKLSDDELEAIVGGGQCFCPVGGFGDEDGLFCWCAVGGVGMVDGYNHVCSQGGCTCLAFGLGGSPRR